MRLPQAAIRAPAPASVFAKRRPNPLVAPVTKAVRPVKSNFMAISWWFASTHNAFAAAPEYPMIRPC